MRISDWSSDVCSSDLADGWTRTADQAMAARPCRREAECAAWRRARRRPDSRRPAHRVFSIWPVMACRHRESTAPEPSKICAMRSEEHTSELQSLMRISYAVLCLKKKKKHIITTK